MLAPMNLLRSVWLAAALAACGDDGDARETTAATGSLTLPPLTTAPATTTVTTADTAGPEDSSGGPATSGPATTGPATTGPATGAVTTMTDDPDTTGAPPTPDGEYAATFIAGEPQRISVRKADAVLDHCTTITFVGPVDAGPLEYDVALPASWRVEGALVHQGATGCLDFAGFPSEPIMALSGNGSASWAGACPKTVALDVLLAFPPGEPWVAAMELLQHAAIAVGNC